MRIAGIEKNSVVDYPGKVAAVVFTPGCNLDCYYCHNHWLIPSDSADVTIRDEEEVLAYLKKRAGLLDAVVVTGGEPTLQPDLLPFLRKVRRMGYLIKLDTNGTLPGVLHRILDEKLVDFVAMDVKAPRHKYAAVTGREVDLNSLDLSIALLIGGEVDYEFRTTMAPQLTKRDLSLISDWIAGAKSHVVQQYRPVFREGFENDIRIKQPAHSSRDLADWAAHLFEEKGTPMATRGVYVA